MSQNFGQVTIGPDFFKKEIKNYSDWRFAWGREVGQNSLDAGAKNITIETERIKVEDGDNMTRVVWVDDGVGMTIDILLNKFLTLGASHKANGNTGGFGWAKTLILFAQNSYRILTNDIILEGCGASYSYTEGNPQVDGCIVEVVLPAHRGIVRSKIKTWVSWTDTKGAIITLDGEKLPTFSEKNIKGTKPTGLDWAKMTVVKMPYEQGEGDVYVRINGQMMHDTWGPDNLKDDIVIDVTGNSPDYFTANRDALTYGKRNELMDVIREMFKDPKAATRIKKPTRVMLKGEKGCISLGTKKEDIGAKLDALLANPEMLAKMLKENAENPAVHEGFTVSVMNETNKNIPSKWMPGMWNKHARTLMTRWCGIILLVGKLADYKGDIVPGWTFSLTDAASWCYSSNTMSLNPVTIDEKTGKMTNRFKLDNSGFVDLVMLVIHEFTHAFGYKYHNEDFIQREERLTKIVMKNWDQFKALRRGLR